MPRRPPFQPDKSLSRPERVLLVGVMLSDSFSGSNEQRARAFQNVLDEAAELVRAGGGELVHVSTARRDRSSGALFVGTGKAEELAAEVQAHNIELAVFNHELTPTQERNLEALSLIHI